MTAHPDIIPDVAQGREYGAPAEASSPGPRPSSRSRPDPAAADRLNPPAAHLWDRPKRNPGPSTGQAIGDIMVG
jgi:hypothetical protein